jgi:hypothetical protein
MPLMKLKWFQRITNNNWALQIHFKQMMPPATRQMMPTATPRQLRAEKPKVANSVRRTGHTFGEKVLLSRQQREQQHGANSVSTKTLNNITNNVNNERRGSLVNKEQHRAKPKRDQDEVALTHKLKLAMEKRSITLPSFSIYDDPNSTYETQEDKDEPEEDKYEDQQNEEDSEEDDYQDPKGEYQGSKEEEQTQKGDEESLTCETMDERVQMAKNNYARFSETLGTMDDDAHIQDSIRRVTRKTGWKYFKMLVEPDYNYNSTFATYMLKALGVKDEQMPTLKHQESMWLRYKKWILEGMQAARSSATQAIKKQFLGKCGVIVQYFKLATLLSIF